ncbi:MAG: hypothetical protein ABSA41_10890 [Terriglobia bacterium]
MGRTEMSKRELAGVEVLARSRDLRVVDAACLLRVSYRRTSAGTSTGGICETRALPGAVIPAEAGIYSASHWKCSAQGLDSRVRGNDQCFERDPIPHDTSTQESECVNLPW